jgi:hypothetical protein
MLLLLTKGRLEITALGYLLLDRQFRDNRSQHLEFELGHTPHGDHKSLGEVSKKFQFLPLSKHSGLQCKYRLIDSLFIVLIVRNP